MLSVLAAFRACTTSFTTTFLSTISPRPVSITYSKTVLLLFDATCSIFQVGNLRRKAPSSSRLSSDARHPFCGPLEIEAARASSSTISLQSEKLAYYRLENKSDWRERQEDYRNRRATYRDSLFITKPATAHSSKHRNPPEAPTVLDHRHRAPRWSTSRVIPRWRICE